MLGSRESGDIYQKMTLCTEREVICKMTERSKNCTIRYPPKQDGICSSTPVAHCTIFTPPPHFHPTLSGQGSAVSEELPCARLKGICLHGLRELTPSLRQLLPQPFSKAPMLLQLQQGSALHGAADEVQGM